MHSVAVYLVQRLYGGPEEGGWHYDFGALCTDPALTASGVTFAEGHEDRARTMALEVQAHLDRDWNVGDHARPISSVLSAGRFEARVHMAGPFSPFRPSVPATNDPNRLGLPFCQPSGVRSHEDLHRPLSNTLPVTGRKSRSRRKMSSAPAAPLVDASHTTDGCKSLDTEHPTYVSACR